MPQSPPHARPPRTTAGFTLLEILIAIVFLVIVIGAVMALQVGGLRANKDTVNLQNAVAISRDVVEQLRGNPQNIPTVCAPSTTTTTQQQGSSTQYTVSCTSTPCSVGANTTDLDALLTQTPTRNLNRINNFINGSVVSKNYFF